MRLFIFWIISVRSVVIRSLLETSTDYSIGIFSMLSKRGEEIKTASSALEGCVLWNKKPVDSNVAYIHSKKYDKNRCSIELVELMQFCSNV